VALGRAGLVIDGMGAGFIFGLIAHSPVPTANLASDLQDVGINMRMEGLPNPI
jgi:hypothetical protein